jgi:hypothetical protein
MIAWFKLHLLLHSSLVDEAVFVVLVEREAREIGGRRRAFSVHFELSERDLELFNVNT